MKKIYIIENTKYTHEIYAFSSEKKAKQFKQDYFKKYHELSENIMFYVLPINLVLLRECVILDT